MKTKKIQRSNPYNDNPVNRLLIERDITQGELAAQVNLDRKYVCKIINGKYQSFPARYKIARALDKSIDELWPV